MTPNQLVGDHLWLVYKVAGAIARETWVDWDELVAAGNLGLVEAASRYVPAPGGSFIKWARIRIAGSMMDAIRGSYWEPKRRAIGRGTLASLDAPVDEEHDDLFLRDLIAASSEDVDEQVAVNDLAVWLLDSLPSRERQVIANRMAGRSYRGLTERWGVTESRVSQIHTQAVAHLVELRDLVA